ncbi:LysM peptidoglycan-binding domain-containing protein [Paenibacillus peoriae]|uniref:LysM peptidoglycan-binding domain-containing protein n=1 Tax=Paenibacillus peoriae TaxID=59893 RepID=A0A7H0Y2N6_9BACL|nr:LysM peptidoglycan-binding domain-containing protein [Paenibacillus peoriae]QNR65344.1 LysM peptidoglycan-binding domain-containing protein [Paenibacillus peoriae]
MSKLTYKFDQGDIDRINQIRDAARDIKVNHFIVNPSAPYTPSTYPFVSSSIWEPADPLIRHRLFPDLNTEPPLQIWSFPASLSMLPKENASDQLPQVKIMKRNNEGNAKPSAVDKYAWMTQFTFRIARSKMVDSIKITEHAHRIIGIDPKDIGLVQKWLEYYRDNDADTDILYAGILFPNNESANVGKLISGKKANVDITIHGLQTENHPPAESFVPEPKDFYDGVVPFVEKLLRCTTASDGNLYYYDEEAKSGLESAFKDGEDSALLRFVCIYNNNVGSHDHITRLVNSTVIGEIIDPTTTILYAEAVQVPVHHVFKTLDFLNSLADFYYMGVVQLAEFCVDVSLQPGMIIHIPMDGIYEVKESSINLDDIVSYTQMDPQAIKDCNPDTIDWDSDLDVDKAIFLPSLEYEVKIGDTLGSLSNYYNIELGRIAEANKVLAGLFAAGSELNFIAGPALRACFEPAGTVSYETEREVPQQIANIQRMSVNEGHYYIEQMFQLLSLRVRENDYFSQSEYSLPISPTEPLSNGQEDLNYSNPKIKRADDDDVWIYKHTLPYYKYAKTQPSLSGGSPLMLLNSNPYCGIGGIVQTDFEWLDIFGNMLNSSKKPGSTAVPPIRAGYQNQLIALDQWPSVTSSYKVTKGRNLPQQLEVTLDFNIEKYKPDGTKVLINNQEIPAHIVLAQMDLLVFQQLSEQIKDAFDPEKPDQVDFIVETSMLNTEFNLKLGYNKLLKGWLENIQQCLSLIIENKDSEEEPKPAPPLPFPMRFEFDMTNSFRSDLMFELVTTFRMRRSKEKVRGAYLDMNPVYDVKTVILPEISKQDFAADFERALQGDGYRVKLAYGMNEQNQNSASGRESIWAIRLDDNQIKGIGFNLSDEPASVFTPAPLNTALITRQAKFTYNESDGEIKEAETKADRDIMLDEELGKVLVAIEEMLSPEYAAPVRFLDYHSQEKLSFISKLTESKTNLAKKLITFLGPVTDVTNIEGLMKARDDFEQKLLAQLPNFYKINAAVQKKAVIVEEESNSELTPQFYGTFESKAVPPLPLTLTSSKLPIRKKNTEDVPFLTTFLSITRPVNSEATASSIVTLTPTYSVTHIEHNIKKLSADNYRTSKWLKFVIPETNTPSKSFIKTVPLILRTYPAKPILTQTYFKQTEKLWPEVLNNTYEVAVRRDIHPPQDEIKLNIKFNQEIKEASLLDVSIDLATQLVRFTDVYPQLKQVYKKNLGSLSESDVLTRGDDDEQIRNSRFVLSALLSSVESIVNALDATIQLRKSEPEIPDVDYSLIISDVSGTDTNKYSLKVMSEPKLPPNLDLVLDNGKENGEKVCMDKIPVSDKEVIFIFEVSTDQAQSEYPFRRIKLKDLHLLQKQSVNCTVSIIRNANLLGPAEPIKDTYIYRTPEISDLSPIGLNVDYKEPINACTLSGGGGKQSIAAHLISLFETIFHDYPIIKAKVVIENFYGYSLDNELVNIETVAVKHEAEISKDSAGKLNYEKLCESFQSGNEAWLNSLPHSTKHGYLHFNITVMSAVSKHPTPLLRLHNYQIPLECIEGSFEVRKATE